MPREFVMSVLALAMLLPVMYRRHEKHRARSAGLAGSTGSRRGRLVVLAVAASLVVGAVAGSAFAADSGGSAPKGFGDATGQTTSIDSSSVLPADTSADQVGPTLAQAVAKDRTSINLIWLMVGGILVLFMQAGFALVETGFTRAKNASHTMMMNLVIFALGAAGWFICGYALMFGATDQSATLGIHAIGSPIHLGSWNILAKSGFFLTGHAYDAAIMGFFFFQLVFMDATATIPTGAMAERFKFSAFCVWGLFASMILYPVLGNWVWGGGWLSQLGTLGPKWGHGALDFAGSGVVHAMGGVAAFWGAKILGPRIGKFDRNGKARAIPGHHLPMAFLGTFILLVGWMGFNGGSTFAGTDYRLAVVITNTVLSAAFGTLSAMALMWKKFGKPDPSMTCNGMLAGLVAVTAPCAFVSPWAAALIGVIAGAIVVYTVLLMDHVLKVDDPVGAVAVHGANGLWGVLALGLFADGKYGDGLNGVKGGVKGLFYGSGGQFLAQVVDAIVIVAWCSLACWIFFTVLNKTLGMRSKAEDEIAGLDLPEMGAMAYPDFLEAQGEVFVPSDDILVGATTGGSGAGGGDGHAARLRSEMGK